MIISTTVVPVFDLSLCVFGNADYNTHTNV